MLWELHRRDYRGSSYTPSHRRDFRGSSHAPLNRGDYKGRSYTPSHRRDFTGNSYTPSHRETTGPVVTTLTSRDYSGSSYTLSHHKGLQGQGWARDINSQDWDETKTRRCASWDLWVKIAMGSRPERSRSRPRPRRQHWRPRRDRDIWTYSETRPWIGLETVSRDRDVSACSRAVVTSLVSRSHVMLTGSLNYVPSHALSLI